MACAWHGLQICHAKLGAAQWGSNRGYAPEQLIEQMIVSIWCGAARFCHADITRLDNTLIRLFGWGRAAGHKAIVRLFQRFETHRNARTDEQLGPGARHTRRGRQRADPLGLTD